jgi:hypothetical protein
MRRLGGLSISLVALVVLVPMTLSADCRCTRQSRDHVYSGGDRSPLTWYSLQRQEHPADPSGQRPPVYCYERQARNHGDQKIRDVYWPVAGYHKPFLPGAPADCCCEATSMPGPLQDPPPAGPLYFGPGGLQYKTAAYAPKDGWPKVTSHVHPLGEGGGDSPPLQATIELAVQTPQEQIVVSHLSLSSTVTIDAAATTYKYRYEFFNEGSVPLFVFWNIPQTGEFREQFFISLRDPLLLKPKERVQRTVTSRQRPAWAYATLLIFDPNRDIASRSLTAVYGFADGEMLRDPLLDWDTPEQR